MIQEWQSFLEEKGAVFDGEQLQHFGDLSNELAAFHSKALLTDLSFQGLVAVEGEEADTFLQNLLTNDVQAVDERHSQLTGLCNPKGRLLALFRLVQQGSRFYLSFPHRQLAGVLKKLNMYVLRSRVKITDVSDRLCRIGLANPPVNSELLSLIGPLPEAANAVCQASDYSVIRLPGEPPRFEIVGQFSALQPLWNELTTIAAPVGANLWKLLNIRAGIAALYPETQETFLPQQINLEFTGGVSLTKGCYPGQEVIARLHYRGKASRRMFLAHLAAAEPPRPGEPLYLAGGEKAQPIGEVVEAQPVPEGGCDSLAVLQLSQVEKGEIALGSKAGPVLTLRELPYRIDSE